MNSKTNILFSFLALLFVSLGVSAQTQSRLNIGQNSDAPKVATTKPVTSLVVRRDMPSEISVNKNSALTSFYRDLLLSNTPEKANEAKSTFVNERLAEDRLYVSDELNVSNIYPNPANEYATLDYRIRGNQKAKVSFLNILGGTLTEQELDPFDTKLRVQTRTWDNGIYFYQLMVDGKKVATKKLLVRHN
ncbi:T9SS type A sorting domain-containing protein [Jiulongibacter sediminis]|uniref:T9SS type A sorting domain-containing protein n=1 Tax=Jiulongibacter sediminis TaxID=1605367 RepID=UPI000A62D2DC|nr:T9SS type A sorting domain-containing protein [Jiulongibacter sediminis]